MKKLKFFKKKLLWALYFSVGHDNK